MPAPRCRPAVRSLGPERARSSRCRAPQWCSRRSAVGTPETMWSSRLDLPRPWASHGHGRSFLVRSQTAPGASSGSSSLPGTVNSPAPAKRESRPRRRWRGGYRAVVARPRPGSRCSPRSTRRRPGSRGRRSASAPSCSGRTGHSSTLRSTTSDPSTPPSRSRWARGRMSTRTPPRRTASAASGGRSRRRPALASASTCSMVRVTSRSRPARGVSGVSRSYPLTG